MPRRFVSLAISIFLLSTLFITCLYPDNGSGSQGEQNEPVTPITPDNPGILRPRIDGFLDPGSASMMAEWQDAQNQSVIFVSPEDGQFNGTLYFKNIGPSLYFALELDTNQASKVMLLLKPDNSAPYLLEHATGELTIYEHVNGVWNATDPSLELGVAVDSQWPLVDNEAQQAGQGQTHEFTFAIPFAEPLHTEYNFSVTCIMDSRVYTMASRDTGQYNDLDEEGLPLIDKALFIPIEPVIMPEPVFDLGLPVDVSITGLEVTQAVQNADSTLRLVAGKKTLARVYVEPATGHFSDSVEVTLRAGTIVGSAKTYLGSLTKTFTARENPDRSRFDESVNFILPLSWTRHPTLSLTAEVRPLEGLDLEYGDNIVRGNYQFHTTHDPVIYVVQSEHWSYGMPSQRDIDNMTENFTWIYPVADPQFIQIGPEALGYWYMERSTPSITHSF